MNWRNIFSRSPKVITEEIQTFKNKGEDNISDRHRELRSGEGIEDLSLIQNIQGFGKESLGTFNMFYSKFINVSFENERQRIFHYRGMAESPEIGDVIEDAAIESTNEDLDGNIMVLEIKDKELSKNANITKILEEEFQELFYHRCDIKRKIFDLFRTYLVDGRVYYERLIHEGKSKNGLVGIKKLPTETMDFLYDPLTGQTLAYFQYLSDKVKRYNNIEEAKMDPNVIVFLPEQIGFIDYGVYGVSKTEIIGFLEKAKQPFNQLKLLETSVIIYRLIRSPERLVFRIDTGNMPKDKAMKFVEEVKRKFTKKVSYDSNTGQMTNNPEVFSLLENYFLPQCLDLVSIISTKEGDKTLSQIIEDHENGIVNYVQSVDQTTGCYVTGEVEWAGITRKDAELIRITLDNDEYVDVTPDHKFCVWKDESKTIMIEVEAQHLTEDMEVVD